MVRNNQSLQRQTFDMLQNKYPGKEISPHFLRAEVVLKNNVNKYKFDHRSLGNESSTEKKLDRNDLVYVTMTQLGWIECEEGEEATAVLNTFAPTTDDAKDLEAIYNGFISLKTGSKVNFESLPTQHFKYVPERVGDDSTGAPAQYNVLDSAYSGVEDLYLHGTKSHEITLEFPSKPNMSIEKAGVVRKAVLIFYGFIIKNGADALNK